MYSVNTDRKCVVCKAGVFDIEDEQLVIIDLCRSNASAHTERSRSALMRSEDGSHILGSDDTVMKSLGCE